VSCNRTALDRRTNTEALEQKELVFLVLLELAEILLPSRLKEDEQEFKTPRVSIAIGSKTQQLSMSAYFASLRDAATSVAEPASMAASFT